MKKFFVVGNWKCNPERFEKAEELLNSVNENITKSKGVQTIICPPFIYIPKNSEDYNFKLGAQDCFWEEKGAYTGEISVLMLRDLNCEYVIIGHSERRRLFNEKGNVIQKKIKACLKEDLTPILCIDKISQLKVGLKRVEEKSKVIVAFEPISAIGSGEPYNPEEAKAMKEKIQGVFEDEQTILYGGSVDSNNVLDFVGDLKFQGILVGGASLDSEEFIKIVQKVQNL